MTSYIPGKKIKMPGTFIKLSRSSLRHQQEMVSIQQGVFLCRLRLFQTPNCQSGGRYSLSLFLFYRHKACRRSVLSEGITWNIYQIK